MKAHARHSRRRRHLTPVISPEEREQLVFLGLMREDEPPPAAGVPTATVESLPRTIPTFGACPECFAEDMVRYDHMVNVRSSHFALCKQHGVYWFVGGNLFSGWTDETEADWDRASAQLAAMREVEPVFVTISAVVPSGTHRGSRSAV